MKNINELRKLRLKKEVQERVLMNDGNLKLSFQDLYDNLFYQKELLIDNDRLLQAIDVQKDINVIQNWIKEYNEL
tara:strand:+ start:1086 stop:1310 length:225 start_codon:yes stop_codon:yes gene_type:complete